MKEYLILLVSLIALMSSVSAIMIIGGFADPIELGGGDEAVPVNLIIEDGIINPFDLGGGSDGSPLTASDPTDPEAPMKVFADWGYIGSGDQPQLSVGGSTGPRLLGAGCSTLFFGAQGEAEPLKLKIII